MSYDFYLDRAIDRYTDELDHQQQLEEQEQREAEGRPAAIPSLDDYDIYCILGETGYQVPAMETPEFAELLKAVRFLIDEDRKITGVLPNDD